VRAVPESSSARVQDVRYQYLLDSGNTLAHATPHSDTVIDHRPTDAVGRAINGEPLNIMSEGSIPGSLADNVYIIPNLEQPVLSVQQLAKQGFTSVFPADIHGGGAYVLDTQHQVVATAGDDYIVDIRQPQTIAAFYNRHDPPGISNINKVKLLQAKLRGLTKQAVIKIAEGGLVLNFPCTADDIRKFWVDDPALELGTMLPRSARHRPKGYHQGQPGDNVHYDGFSVSVPAVLHKYDVCTIYVDRATLFVMIQFGYKTDTAEDVAKQLWRLHKRYKLHQHRIVNLQQDNASTHLAEETSDAALAMEINHVFKPPYMKESLEESMVHQFKNIMLTSFAAAPYVPQQLWPYAAMRAVSIINLKNAPNSDTLSRAFMFTGVMPDWNRTPLDDFGAPYIVAKPKETRVGTWDGHGEWAAYLCPCHSSTPEVHYFVLMDRNHYLVVRRGAYRRVADVPDQWWLNLPDNSELDIHIQGGNSCPEADWKAFDGMDVHFPFKGLNEASTQTEDDVPLELTNELPRQIYAGTVTTGVQVQPSTATRASQTDKALEKRLVATETASAKASAEVPYFLRHHEDHESPYFQFANKQTALAAALTSGNIQTDTHTDELVIASEPLTTVREYPHRWTPAEIDGLITHDDQSRGDEPWPGHPPPQVVSSSSVGELHVIDIMGDDNKPPAHVTTDITLLADERSHELLTASTNELMRVISSLTFKAQDIPPRRLERLRTLKTETKTIMAAKRAGKKRVKSGYPGDNPTLQEALSGPDRAKWLEAIEAELTQLENKKSWVRLLRLPHGAKSIPAHFVLKRKRKADGAVDKYKARLVAGGHRQLQWMYDKTFAPTANAESIKLIYSIAAKQSLYIRMFDVVGAYLLADLESPEPLYMIIPGFIGGPQLVVELKKSLYGLKQAGHLWNKMLDKALKHVGFKATVCDPCLYTLERGDDRIIVGIHVDDLLFASTSNALVDEIVLSLQVELNAELEEVTESGSHLGISVVRNEDGSITMTQPGYITRMAHTLGLEDATPVDTPLPVAVDAPIDSPPVDITTYQQVLGLLMYAACHTRPDISFAVALLATRVSKPTDYDLQLAYRVVRYLYATKHLGLTFSADGAITMYGYVDAAYNLHPDAKGHSGILLTLGLSDAPFCHRSKKQTTVARSSTEAEYAAVDSAVLDIEFFRQLLAELGYAQDSPTTLYQDNMSTITVLQSENYTARTKHYAMRYHYVKQAVQEHTVVFEYLPTHLHTADILTKSLTSRHQFYVLRAQLLNCQPTPDGQ
jgi:Reverse transcriptase (RNA-dependent DNA polymerase)